MNKFRSWAATAVIVSSGLLYSAFAAAQAPVAVPQPGVRQSAAGPRLALLDVGRIFKNHQRFKAAMENMKREVAAEEEKVNQKKNAILKLADMLQQYAKGSAEYRQTEEDIARQKADLTVQVSLQKNKFVQHEAEIYNAVYQEILQATDAFCRQHAIDMVLRFTGDQVNVEEPQSVLGYINRPVVWYAPDLDITNDILTRLNASAPAATATQTNTPGARAGVPFK